MDEQTNRGWRWGVGPVALALTLGAPLTACNYELHNDVITDASTDTGGDETATGETGSFFHRDTGIPAGAFKA